MKNNPQEFNTLSDIAVHFRKELDNSKRYILLFAYNGIGKTRLSMDFRNLGKKGDVRDTLYYNAFTEDLFVWDNDLEGDSKRQLRLNKKSRFFRDLEGFDIDNNIRNILNRYADFDFRIDAEEWTVTFSRKIQSNGNSHSAEYIKISRGEESIFIWCFFLAVLELAMDESVQAYDWVKYVYIDDPISSLDENYAIAVAHHIIELFKPKEQRLKLVISSHHTLFFNRLYNGLRRAKGNKFIFLDKSKDIEIYKLKETKDTPFFYHVAMLQELEEAVETGKLYTYHFNIFRAILEKTASFHGYDDFSYCIKKDKNDEDAKLYKRLIHTLSHGGYSHYELTEMRQDNKDSFKKALRTFLENYDFNVVVDEENDE